MKGQNIPQTDLSFIFTSAKKTFGTSKSNKYGFSGLNMPWKSSELKVCEVKENGLAMFLFGRRREPCWTRKEKERGILDS